MNKFQVGDAVKIYMINAQTWTISKFRFAYGAYYYSFVGKAGWVNESDIEAV